VLGGAQTSIPRRTNQLKTIATIDKSIRHSIYELVLKEAN
jgi:hypothetical protein